MPTSPKPPGPGKFRGSRRNGIWAKADSRRGRGKTSLLVGGDLFQEMLLVDLLQGGAQCLHRFLVAGGLSLSPRPEHLEGALVGGPVGALFDVCHFVVWNTERLA